MTSKITTTLIVDGEPVQPGSLEAVTIYKDMIRDVYQKLLDSRQLLSHVPDEVQHRWRNAADKAEHQVDVLIGPVARFAEDYEKRGLESAVADARFRKELS